MKTRPITIASDHATLARWWQAHGWPVIDPSMLPPTGLIVEDLAAAFLYKTDGGIAILEWTLVNPESDKMRRREALSLLITDLCEEARRCGFRVVFTFASHPGLLDRYQAHGFQLTDQGMTHLLRRL